ncbi:uncharacterized protein A4U43_C10F5580 [Asparagus officinalis]|uniref:RING-CH-type domain-containing protein n=1 Tax=Asparagus officinalis TaxID=4686 RepID=A0A5P1E0X7_ASPOF|nr:uncharacterized protein LOC109825090 [Asparagus officinalis]XP_020247399.1 uncharacterized protein LOC109825090 [Asparagus officinalis]ONK56242.1 uncharacterized protein A4U43_C10F5580 [Asparagus officinalis]
MGVKEEQKQSDGVESNGATNGETNEENLCPSADDQALNTLHTPNSSTDKDLLLCRVCHCAESDRRGDAALGFLNIFPPPLDSNGDGDSIDKVPKKDVKKDVIHANNSVESGFVEFISPEGEVFVCSADIESGSYCQQDTLVDLGCSCKNELALSHYACALKWFISHGSTVCEICGSVAKNIRHSDFKKVMASLKEYEALKEKTATGELAQINVVTNSNVDPDALAAVRRQRLSEVSLWFNPHNNSVVVSQETVDQVSNPPPENIVMVENTTTKWAVEGTGILVATGLLTVTLAWLIAPHVGKKTARNGLHILLGGVCALTAVIFLRFVILSRIKYGPARYWAILFVFWFLVFGIWASRSHGHQ